MVRTKRLAARNPSFNRWRLSRSPSPSPSPSNRTTSPSLSPSSVSSDIFPILMIKPAPPPQTLSPAAQASTSHAPPADAPAATTEPRICPPISPTLSPLQSVMSDTIPPPLECPLPSPPTSPIILPHIPFPQAVFDTPPTQPPTNTHASNQPSPTVPLSPAVPPSPTVQLPPKPAPAKAPTQRVPMTRAAKHSAISSLASASKKRKVESSDGESTAPPTVDLEDSDYHSEDMPPVLETPFILDPDHTAEHHRRCMQIRKRPVAPLRYLCPDFL